jgi:hypothetical protein
MYTIILYMYRRILSLTLMLPRSDTLISIIGVYISFATTSIVVL